MPPPAAPTWRQKGHTLLHTLLNAPLWVFFVGCAGGVLAGVLLRFWVSSQRFARLNPLGVEAFDSLGSLAAARVAETLTGWASNLLLAGGLGLGLVVAARYLFLGY